MARDFDPTIVRLAAAEFTRPANNTVYTTGDVIGPVTTPAAQILARAAWSAGAGGEIVAIRLSKNTTTVTLFTVRVWFYNAVPIVVADNLAWNQNYDVDRGKFIGYRDLDLAVSGTSGTAFAQMAATATPLPYTTAAGSGGNLFAVISAIGGYTPGSAEQFSLSVTVKKY